MSGKVRAGKLEHLISIQEELTSQDDSGQEIKTYVERRKAWGNVLPMRGQEKFMSGREMATIVYKFRIRWFDSLLPTDFLLYNGQMFDIININPGGTKNREYFDVLGQVLESDGF